MATPRALDYQLWTALECDGGAYLETLPRMGTRTKLLNGEGTLTTTVPLVHTAAPHVDTGRIVRVRLSNGGAEEWRISTFSIRSGGSGEEYSITALRDTYELSERKQFLTRVIERTHATNPHVDQVVETAFVAAGVTPLATLTADVMPALPSFWTLRTVEPTTPIYVEYNNDVPRSGIQKIITALGDRGVFAEVNVEKRPGTAGYYLDLLTQIGSTAAVVQVHTARNLRSLTYSKRRDTFASSVSARGEDGTSIADARWLVTNVAGNVLTLGMVDGSAGGPIGYNDQFNTDYYVEKMDGTYTQITDCDALARTVTVASAAGIAVNHAVRFRYGTSKQTLTLLHAATVANPRLKSLPIRGGSARTNFIGNPVFPNWSAGLPVSYTEVDPRGELTVSENATKIYHGAKSAKLTHVVGAPSTAVFFGLQAADRYILPPFGVNTTIGISAGCWAYFAYTESGNVDIVVRVEINGATQDYNSATTTAYRDAWVQVAKTGQTILPTTAIAVKVGVVAGAGLAGTNTICYLSGMFLEQIADPAAVPYRVNSSPAEMWAAGNEYLINPNVLSLKYEFEFIDLARHDSVTWPNDDIVLGGSVRLKDTIVNQDVTARIVSLTLNDEQPLKSQAVVSTIPRRFSFLYAEAAA